MADQDHFLTLSGILDHFQMDLGDQWTGRIEHLQSTSMCRTLHRMRDSMGTEDDGRVVRHFIQLFDKDRALVTQLVDHELVMDHFVAHVDGRTMNFDGTFNNFNGSVNTCTKATRIGE